MSNLDWPPRAPPLPMPDPGPKRARTEQSKGLALTCLAQDKTPALHSQMPSEGPAFVPRTPHQPRTHLQPPPACPFQPPASPAQPALPLCVTMAGPCLKPTQGPSLLPTLTSSPSGF